MIGAAIVATMLLVGALVWSAAKQTTPGASSAAATGSTATQTPAVPVRVVSSTTTSARVEVPDLGLMTVEQAATILRAAGLAMRVSRAGSTSAAAQVVVHSQQPPAGTVASAGSAVTIVVPTLTTKPRRKSAAKRGSGGYVVVIDPGHQSRADQVLEPVGPGSADTKPRVTAGATGVVSGVPEYEIDLEVATNLRKRLEAAGVRVVMTRTTNDVDISNIERAQVANRAKADLFIRVHADSSTDPKSAGVSTLYPVSNSWTKPIVDSSAKAAAIIQQRVLSSTGAQDDGAVARSDIAGFNWSQVPCVLVETGFQSNPVEDKLLSSAHYQDLLAQGMADGIMAYLGGR